MTNQKPESDEGYEIVEGPDFLTKAEVLTGSVERWDEIRLGLDRWLFSRPTELPMCRHVREDLWFARIAASPHVYLLYEVNKHRRRVTYLDIRLVPPPLHELDPDFRA